MKKNKRRNKMYKNEWIKDLSLRELMQIENALTILECYGIGDKVLLDEINEELEKGAIR
jgi:hypothetical protein